jgi:hypothetical protein
VKTAISVGVVALVVGCASFQTKLDRELRPFVGQNITALSAVLGDPESMDTVGSERQYNWQVDNRFTLLRSRSGFYLVDLSRAPFSNVAGGTQEVPMHDECNLQVVTDRDGVIKSFHSKGNEGCQRFVTAMEM